MSKALVSSLFAQSSNTRKLQDAITQSEFSTTNQQHFDKLSVTTISGLVGSSYSIVIAEVFKTADKPFLIILNDKEEAAYHLNDLENLLGEKNVLL